MGWEQLSEHNWPIHLQPMSTMTSSQAHTHSPHCSVLCYICHLQSLVLQHIQLSPSAKSSCLLPGHDTHTALHPHDVLVTDHPCDVARALPTWTLPWKVALSGQGLAPRSPKLFWVQVSRGWMKQFILAQQRQRDKLMEVKSPHPHPVVFWRTALFHFWTPV